MAGGHAAARSPRGRRRHSRGGPDPLHWSEIGGQRDGEVSTSTRVNQFGG